MTNKDIIINYSKTLWEERNLDVIEEVFDSSAVLHSPLNHQKGSLTMRDLAEKWLTSFPDLEIAWEDFIADGDKVVSRWTATGTHMGSFFETSPTHKEITYAGVTTYKLKDGKVVEYWALVDMHAILSQLEVYQSISEAVD